MPTDEPTWKRCSTCKRPLGFRAPYFACSVSTCNRKGTDFAFCSVGCWDAHVPLLRHRDAWADEKTSPTREEWERERPKEAPRTEAPRRIVVTPGTRASEPRAATPEPASGGRPPREVLVVVSKLKAYIRAVSDMNTSDDVIESLSDRLRILCDDAIERARDDGRKTVMARDFRR